MSCRRFLPPLTSLRTPRASMRMPLGSTTWTISRRSKTSRWSAIQIWSPSLSSARRTSRAVDVGPVGGAQILQDEGVPEPAHDRVQPRDHPRRQHDVVLGGAPHRQLLLGLQQRREVDALDVVLALGQLLLPQCPRPAHRRGEAGVVLDQPGEVRAAEHPQLASGLRLHAGNAGATREQRDLAEELAGAQAGDRAAARLHRERAEIDQVERVGRPRPRRSRPRRPRRCGAAAAWPHRPAAAATAAGTPRPD